LETGRQKILNRMVADVPWINLLSVAIFTAVSPPEVSRSQRGRVGWGESMRITLQS